MSLSTTAETTVYNHKSRPRWGLAILAWEGRDKRRYQFQDGKLRTFKRGYYELLEPVADVEDDVLRDLRSMLRTSRHFRGEQRKPAAKMDDQIETFRAAYPDGFGDPEYRAEVRGEGASRTKKRHRDPVLAAARADLSAGPLGERIAAGDFAGVRDALAAVLRTTDLVPVRDAKLVEGLGDESLESVARALHDVLHGESSFAMRFDVWVKVLREALGKNPSWQLVTAPLALVHPDVHVVVRPTVFRRQAKRLDPELAHTTKPNGILYERYRTMASVLRTRLEQAGMAPRDMIDVYDFVWATMRRSARG